MLMICGCGQEPAADAGPDGFNISFTDVTAPMGLDTFRHRTGAVGNKWFPETMGAGGGFIDYNGDGWQDIILVGGGAFDARTNAQVRKLWLFENINGDRFALVDSALPDQLPGYGFGIVATDYDNDGDEDLYFTTLGPNHLLRNDDGVFVNVTSAAGLGAHEEWSTAAIFFDADRDGNSDLYTTNYVDWSPEKDLFCSLDGERKGYCTPEIYEGTPGRYYHNDGDGTFTEMTSESGLGVEGGKTLGVTELDFNGDQWPDLAVANDTDPDQLYRNDGDGTFTEIGVMSGIAFDERGRARAGMGIDAGVVDATGQETIFVGNFSNQMIGVYRHINDGAFLDRAATSQIGRASMLTLTFGLALIDIDLDGDLDLFAANGHVQPHIESVKDNVSFEQPSHLFINDGNGNFEDAALSVGGVLTDSLISRGAAYADFDHDGDIDLLVTENGRGARLWRNDVAGGNYLRIKLNGTASSSEGIGARIRLYANDRMQQRRIRTGGSFLSQSEKIATFGLGSEQRIDSIVVSWPSGSITRIHDVTTNQVLEITEQ